MPMTSDSATFQIAWHPRQENHISPPRPKYEMFYGRFRPNYFIFFNLLFSERHLRLILVLPNCPELEWTNLL